MKRLLVEKHEAAYKAYQAALDRNARSLAPPGTVDPSAIALDQAWAVLEAWTMAVKIECVRYADHPDYLAEWRP